MRKTLFQQKSCSPEETFLLGETLGKEARGGDIYLLSGIPGAGKTVFTKGFAIKLMPLILSRRMRRCT